MNNLICDEVEQEVNENVRTSALPHTGWQFTGWIK